MRKSHKITLGTLGVLIGILSGVLTLVEKTVTIVNAIKPKASESPKEYKVESRQMAGRIDKDSEITTAVSGK